MVATPETERLRAIPVSVEDAQEFFDARKVRLTCELCDVTDWAFSVDYVVSHLPLVLATCRNCGNMRHHSKIPIQIWKDRKAGDEQR